MKLQVDNKTTHDLLSPVASLIAQVELIKRSDDYRNLSEATKKSIDRMGEKLTLLGDRLKSFFRDNEIK